MEHQVFGHVAAGDHAVVHGLTRGQIAQRDHVENSFKHHRILVLRFRVFQSLDEASP